MSNDIVKRSLVCCEITSDINGFDDSKISCLQNPDFTAVRKLFKKYVLRIQINNNIITIFNVFKRRVNSEFNDNPPVVDLSAVDDMENVDNHDMKKELINELGELR